MIDAFFATADRDSILGTYSIDEIGDTTLDRMTGYRFEARDGRHRARSPVRSLSDSSRSRSAGSSSAKRNA